VTVKDFLQHHEFGIFKNTFAIIFGALLLVCCPIQINEFEFPVFRVIIDPGHGGVGRRPIEKHGDRYDSISGKYLDLFKEGASLRGLYERDIVYNIAKKTEKYLELCKPGGDNYAFYQLIRQYTDEDPDRINIVTYSSRKKSITEEQADTMQDPNAEYRLFDYPGPDGNIQQGRLSTMNQIKPHMIVSLHLAEYGPNDYHGISPVIAVPYSLLYKGFRYLKGDRWIKSDMERAIIDNWFCEDSYRSSFQWFLNDVSLYFTSFPLKKNLSASNDFKGYRYNMINWKYKDFNGWEYVAKSHPVNTRYAKDINEFVPDGKFWVREQSVYEKYRREGGTEGFGGDNAYASYEIIRYILYTLYNRSNRQIRQKAGKSYNNVWIVPLHVNAINVFLELGYLRRSKDRYIMIHKQDEIAQGIAVGIYSLFAGLKMKNEDFNYLPRGKKIDLEKYQMSDEKTYFDNVIE